MRQKNAYYLKGGLKIKGKRGESNFSREGKRTARENRTQESEERTGTILTVEGMGEEIPVLKRLKV